MKKILSSVLALCFVTSLAIAPAMAAQKVSLPPEIEPKEIVDPRLVDTIPFSVEGDFDMDTVSESTFLYEGDKVTVNGTWGHPYPIQIRLLKEDQSWAMTATMDIGEQYTFIVPKTGTYVLQVACDYDVSGTLSVNW